MSLRTVHVETRAAMRDLLLDVVDLDLTVTATAAGGVLTRASGSWIDDGFAIGQELTVSGPASGLVHVKGLEALKLTTTGAFSGTGAFRLLAAIPAQRAWEGAQFRPGAQPYVAEVVQPVSTERRSMGPTGLLEHRILGAFNLFYPRLGTTLAIERMAGAVLDAFRPGTSITRNGVGGRIERASRTPVMADGEWLSCAVTATALIYT